MSALRAAVVAFLGLKLSVLVVNLLQFPVLGRGRRPPGSPPRCPGPLPVSLLVPMRNEAADLPAHLPALLEQDVAELIVLDDRSDDESVARATALLAGHPRGRVVVGTPPPSGWVGKNWACHQLAELSSQPLLVFCDADVHLAPEAITRVVEEMRRQRADVFSVFPRQRTGSLGEHLITPLVDDVLLCFLPFGLLSAPVPRAATANGSVLAFTRAAFDELGGFAAVRGELVEDVALARLTRSAGLKLGLALGGDEVGTRMYVGYREVVRGFGRGLLSVVGGSRAVLVAGLGWHLVVYTMPWLVVWRRRSWLWVIALGVAERALVEFKTGTRAVWHAPLVALSPIAAVPVIAQALRRSQTWKDRVYP